MIRQIERTFILLLVVLTLAACGGSGADDGGAVVAPEPTETAVPVGDAIAGENLYTQSCSACHGPGATGVTGLGKDLTASEFVLGQSDAELLAFVKSGRSVSDPANTTGIDMPPKGGNPALSDAQIGDIIAYIRTLHR